MPWNSMKIHRLITINGLVTTDLLDVKVFYCEISGDPQSNLDLSSGEHEHKNQDSLV